MELNFEGIAVGAASLLVIGAFHPLVPFTSEGILPLHLQVVGEGVHGFRIMRGMF